MSFSPRKAHRAFIISAASVFDWCISSSNSPSACNPQCQVPAGRRGSTNFQTYGAISCAGSKKTAAKANGRRVFRMPLGLRSRPNPNGETVRATGFEPVTSCV